MVGARGARRARPSYDEEAPPTRKAAATTALRHEGAGEEDREEDREEDAGSRRRRRLRPLRCAATTVAPVTEDVEIGTNPTRRYGSAGSRALGR